MKAEGDEQQFLPEDFPPEFEIHQSHIKDFHECGELWRLRHVEGIQPGIAENSKRYGSMIRGAVTHDVSHHCRRNPQAYSVDDCADLMKTGWTENEDAQQLPEEEAPPWEKHGKWVHDHLEAHKGERIIGLEMPLSTEKRPLTYRGMPVQGHMDELVIPEDSEDLVVRDLKTGKVTPNELNLVGDVQAQMYSWAARAQTGKAVGFSIWHMPKAKAVPEKAPLVYSDDELRRFETRVLDTYLQAILLGLSIPNTQRQFGGCAHCLYYEHCWGRI
jgi:hypothetical protein